jgi:hypothetical protein
VDVRIDQDGGLLRAPRPVPSSRQLRLGVAALLVVVLLVGCGGGGPRTSATANSQATLPELQLKEIPGVRQRLLGSGPQAVVIVTSAQPVKPRSTVFFLHAWFPYPPSIYGAWLAHLVRRGNLVVYPVSQDSRTTAATVLANTLSDVRRAFAALPTVPRPVIVAGITTGGALAADYAASSRAAHLPVPAAIFAVYPGRNPGVGVINAVDPARIAPATRLVVVGGSFNPVVNGAAEAKEMLRGASNVPRQRRSYVSAADPDPGGPEEAGAAARRSFWAPLDRLIAEVRNSAGPGPR